MVKSASRRSFLGGIGAFLISGPAIAGAPERSLRPRMRNGGLSAVAGGSARGLIEQYGLPGQVACAVADVKTGLRLESVNGDSGLPPASVAKAVTALYALDRLGPAHRFKTRIMITGALKDGILDGDLYLSGGGDPVLDTDDLAALAAAMKAAGIREVRGAFKVHEGVLPYARTIDKGQPDHLAYSPAVSGIALNFNRVHFQWKRNGSDYTVTMDARTKKYRPDVDIARMKVRDRKLPVYTYERRDGRENWTVARGQLGKGGSRWLPVRDPAAYAGDVFRTMARSQGVVLPKAKTTRGMSHDARVIAVHHSPPLRSLLKAMLKYSNNLTAEMVGLSASAARGGRPAGLADSAARMSRWAGERFGMTGTRLVDHSGLGDASRMTADDLLSALIAARSRDALGPLLKPFALRDEKGRIVKSHPIMVHAKTGTLNYVSGLGGFMTAADGTELAFAIFTADIHTRARIRRADRERPRGARSWNRRSRILQQKLIERWGAVYGS